MKENQLSNDQRCAIISIIKTKLSKKINKDREVFISDYPTPPGYDDIIESKIKYEQAKKSLLKAVLELKAKLFHYNLHEVDPNDSEREILDDMAKENAKKIIPSVSREEINDALTLALMKDDFDANTFISDFIANFVNEHSIEKILEDVTASKK